MGRAYTSLKGACGYIAERCGGRSSRRRFARAVVGGGGLYGPPPVAPLACSFVAIGVHWHTPKQVEKARRERDLAAACGYDFVIGGRSDAHKNLLEALLPGFNIVLSTLLSKFWPTEQ
nr:DUF6310 domain-containing protein [Vitiosangium sp. GDMCC 1.1324]